MEIYLDNCATTKVCRPAVDAAVKAMEQDYGNPSSLHRKGMDAEKILTEGRKLIASVLNCSPDCIYYTASATESNNLAILGSAAAYPRGGKTIVTTAVEHPSVENTVAFLEGKGYTVRRVAPRADRNFDAADLIDAVDEDTLLLSMMLVNNETGTVTPVEPVVSALRKKYPRLLIHVDGVQGFTKIPLNLKKTDIDFFSFSGHKLYAPKGIAGLYVKKGIRLSPVIYGGGQEKGLRSGTQSVPLIAAMTEAIRLCRDHSKEYMEHYGRLNRHLRQALEEMPDVVIGSPENGCPHLLNLSVLGIPSEIMLHFLEERGIYVSSGSACSKGELSHVLRFFGFDSAYIRSALRVSFSKDTTIEELDLFTEALGQGIQKLKKVIGS